MNEWGVVAVISALVGLFFTVGKPILSLNKNITMLNVNIEHNSNELSELKADFHRQRTDAHESHQRLWDHNEVQDKQLLDHEKRIYAIEQK